MDGKNKSEKHGEHTEGIWWTDRPEGEGIVLWCHTGGEVLGNLLGLSFQADGPWLLEAASSSSLLPLRCLRGVRGEERIGDRSFPSWQNDASVCERRRVHTDVAASLVCAHTLSVPHIQQLLTRLLKALRLVLMNPLSVNADMQAHRRYSSTFVRTADSPAPYPKQTIPTNHLILNLPQTRF